MTKENDIWSFGLIIYEILSGNEVNYINYILIIKILFFISNFKAWSCEKVNKKIPLLIN